MPFLVSNLEILCNLEPNNLSIRNGGEKFTNRTIYSMKNTLRELKSKLNRSSRTPLIRNTWEASHPDMQKIRIIGFF